MDEYKKILAITSPKTQHDIVNDFEMTKQKTLLIIKDKTGGNENTGSVTVFLG